MEKRLLYFILLMMFISGIFAQNPIPEDIKPSPVTKSKPVIQPNKEIAAILGDAKEASVRKSWDDAFALYKKAKELGDDGTAGYNTFMKEAKYLKNNSDDDCNSNIKKHLNYAKLLKDTPEVNQLLKECENAKTEKKEEIIVIETEPEPMIVIEAEPEPKPMIIDENVIKALINILSEPIFFELNEYNLTPSSIEILDRKVAILKKYPVIKIVIAGNTCDLGDNHLNVPLSQHRADVARDYLEKGGINANRMTTISQASNYPMDTNTDEKNRSKNERCDFKPSGY